MNHMHIYFKKDNILSKYLEQIRDENVDLALL